MFVAKTRCQLYLYGGNGHFGNSPSAQHPTSHIFMSLHASGSGKVAFGCFSSPITMPHIKPSSTLFNYSPIPPYIFRINSQFCPFQSSCSKFGFPCTSSSRYLIYITTIVFGWPQPGPMGTLSQPSASRLPTFSVTLLEIVQWRLMSGSCGEWREYDTVTWELSWPIMCNDDVDVVGKWQLIGEEGYSLVKSHRCSHQSLGMLVYNYFILTPIIEHRTNKAQSVCMMVGK